MIWFTWKLSFDWCTINYAEARLEWLREKVLDLMGGWCLHHSYYLRNLPGV